LKKEVEVIHEYKLTSQLYLPGMWATIAMQIMYSIVTFCMSMYFKRQNRLADEGKKPALEGVEGFRYAP
jgi:hypothetical protein